jgi:hypothetical protein
MQLVRRKPFVPLRLHASDGRTIEIRHPDQMMVFRTHIITPVQPQDDEPAERAERLSIDHLVRIEDVEPAESSAA